MFQRFYLVDISHFALQIGSYDSYIVWLVWFLRFFFFKSFFLSWLGHVGQKEIILSNWTDFILWTKFSQSLFLKKRSQFFFLISNFHLFYFFLLNLNKETIARPCRDDVSQNTDRNCWFGKNVPAFYSKWTSTICSNDIRQNDCKFCFTSTEQNYLDVRTLISKWYKIINYNITHFVSAWSQLNDSRLDAQ